MITFMRLGTLGRLGNQLFQYAALRSLSLENGYECKIPNPANCHWDNQDCLLGNFNIEAEYLTNEDLEKIKYAYHEPDHMSYDNNFYNIPDNTNIHGFFQSTHYFEKHSDQIRKELTPKKHFLDQANKKIDSLRKKYNKEIVSLHIRRGDFPANEYKEMYGDNDELPGGFLDRYLKKAIPVFDSKNIMFLVFSGGHTNNENETDLDWCRKRFDSDRFIVTEPADTMMDLSLMMCCDHNIMTPNCSFGWWPPYLNKSDNKVVLVPNHYHADKPNYTHRDGFYPREWSIL